MADYDEINQLQKKLELLLDRQKEFTREIHNLWTEIQRLKKKEFERNPVQADEISTPKSEIREPEIQMQLADGQEEKKIQPAAPVSRPEPAEVNLIEPEEVSSMEKFIGENLFSKIGIAITVLGVGFGVKYAIDHDLISPLTRIILGYLFGIGIFGFGVRLKKDYRDFSAVLISGSMAIFYFITYAAYNYYQLMPQMAAFLLMVLFTAGTVAAALHYDRQVIAHIGMVGAYAVPFLLSDPSGSVLVLFSYIAIINAGILVLAFRKYWKPVYYVSMGLTWLIYLSWFASKNFTDENFTLALVFIILFFATFYTIFLAGKLLQQEKFEIDDIILLLANSGIFYGLGYALLNGQESGKPMLGLFSLSNALVHFGVSALFFYRPSPSKNLFYLVSLLGLVFISIAIPVQLDGNWVTLLWCGEAALLFWIGRTKNIPAWEKLSWPLMVLAFISLLKDWSTYQAYEVGHPETLISPVFNINFLTSLFALAAFGLVSYFNREKKYFGSFVHQKDVLSTLTIGFSVILVFISYFFIFKEIETYWDQLYKDSMLVVTEFGRKSKTWNFFLSQYKTIWILIYTMLYLSALSLLNLKKWKSRALGMAGFVFISLTLLMLFTLGQVFMTQFREAYLGRFSYANYPAPGISAIWIRYLALACLGLLMVITHKLANAEFMPKKLGLIFDFMLAISLLWVASTELINVMVYSGYFESNRLVLSILWGIFSLGMIAWGIWKKKRHIRIGAIVLFGITLMKLFFYDISHLDSMAKTIVFVSLGILLLIISFLYTKFKHLILD